MNNFPKNHVKGVDRIVKNIVKLRKTLKFDAIACTGLSGASIAFTVSYFTKIPIIYLRKHTTRTHGSPIEFIGTNCNASYIILDDFVETGATVKRILRKLKYLECKGIYSYISGVSYEHHVDYKGIRYKVYERA